MIEQNRSYKRIVLVFLAAVVATAVIAYVFSKNRSKPIQFRSHIAVPGFQSSALVILAHAKGFFRDEGVDVSLEYKSTGRDCLALVVKGEADLAVVFETPIVRSLLEGNKIAVLTELHRSEENTAVVARKDRGIKKAEDLIGKTIATIAKTNAEFHLDLFLRSHLIDPAKVKIKQMSIQEAVNAVASGTVDASALWQPYVSQSIHESPANFELLKSSFYSEFSMLAGLQPNLENNKEANAAIMKALLRARDYFESENLEARNLVENILVDNKFFVTPAAWDQMDVHLGLSASLLTMFSIEAEWYRAQGHVGGPEKIDNVLYSPYLKSLAPQLVTYE